MSRSPRKVEPSEAAVIVFAPTSSSVLACSRLGVVSDSASNAAWFEPASFRSEIRSVGGWSDAGTAAIT